MRKLTCCIMSPSQISVAKECHIHNPNITLSRSNIPLILITLQLFSEDFLTRQLHNSSYWVFQSWYIGQTRHSSKRDKQKASSSHVYCANLILQVYVCLYGSVSAFSLICFKKVSIEDIFLFPISVFPWVLPCFSLGGKEQIENYGYICTHSNRCSAYKTEFVLGSNKLGANMLAPQSARELQSLSWSQ